jgi:hypothetical protein
MRSLIIFIFYYFFVGVIKSGRMVSAVYVEYVERMKNAYKYSDWKPRGKITVGRPKHACEDIFRLKMGPKGIVCEC